MLTHLFKFAVAIIAIGIIQSVIVSHSNTDIRESILSSFQEKPKKELFKVFHFLFQKKYDLNSEEGLNRYRTFKSNLKFIEVQNTKNLGFTLGITELTDLTADEFRKTRLSTIVPEKVDADMQKFLRTEPTQEKFQIHYQDDDEDDLMISNSKSANPAVQQTTKIDWRAFMNPAANQGGCGSCWAFAAIHAIEGNFNVQFTNSPAFSQQQLVDCDTISFACEGGYPREALDYLKKTGLAFYNDYPYISGQTGQRDSCKASSVTMNKVVSGYEECRYKRCEKSTQRQMLSKGPIIVYIDGDGRSEGNSIFQHYKSGVLEMPCITINHAVNMIGVDSDVKGEFYIGMNTWGSGWGENGNFRIRARDSDQTCFMETWGLLPIVQNTTNPIPPPPEPQCMKIYSECLMKGSVREICDNTPRITDFPIMAGFDIGKFKTIKVFFREQNCRGSFFTLEAKSYTCFIENGLTLLNNSIKSLIVDEQSPPTGCVWLYDDNCLSGNKIEVCSDVSNLDDPIFKFGNKISSIKFGPGVRLLTVFLDKDYKGSFTNIRGDRYGLERTWLNKDIESVKITKA